MASEGGITVALDLELDDALRREGLARELVRLVQDARKAAGLDVSDRIELGVEAGRRSRRRSPRTASTSRARRSPST